MVIGCSTRANSSTSTANTIITPVAMAMAKLVTVPSSSSRVAQSRLAARPAAGVLSVGNVVDLLHARGRARAVQVRLDGYTAALVVAAYAVGPSPKLMSATAFSGTAPPKPWAPADSRASPDCLRAVSMRLTRIGTWRSASENLALFCVQVAERRDADRLADALHRHTELGGQVQVRMHQDLRAAACHC